MTVNMNETLTLNVARLCPCFSFLVGSLSWLAPSLTSFHSTVSLFPQVVSTDFHPVMKTHSSVHTNMLTDQTTEMVPFLFPLYNFERKYIKDFRHLMRGHGSRTVKYHRLSLTIDYIDSLSVSDNYYNLHKAAVHTSSSK